VKQIFIFSGIFISLALSRFIPHPPNFTSLLALSFYVPVFLGLRYLPALLISFVITDFFIGYHTLKHWTWGSVLLIGLMSSIFSKNIKSRFIGIILINFIFFIITNFGVWTSGMYDYTLELLLKCYLLAIPFFGNLFFSTILFSFLIEFIYFCYFKKFFIKKLNTN
jgi:hypothetical protein